MRDLALLKAAAARVALALLLLGGPWAPPAPARAGMSAWPGAWPTLRENPKLSEAQERRLGRGEILVHYEHTSEAIKMVTSIGRVDRGAGDVYRLMTDFRNYTRIYNSLSSANVESEGDYRVVASYGVKTPWPLPGRTVTTETFLDPDHFSFLWTRRSGTLKVYDGQLVAVPVDADHCTVFYSARVDPGYAFVPGWFVTWSQSYVLPSIIRAIRDTLDRRTGPYWAAGVKRPQFDREPSVASSR